MILKDIEYYLPTSVLSNDIISQNHPEWPISKIYEKTGISKRHIAQKDEYTLDMAIQSAKKLLKNHLNLEIEYLIVCTQTSNYLLPSLSCILQSHLSLSKLLGAVDISQGCSGYIYGLSLSKALIDSKQASKILLITTDTYSKIIHQEDKSAKTIFGDASTATLIEYCQYINNEQIFCFFTDSEQFNDLFAINSSYCNENKTKLIMNGSNITYSILKNVPVLFDSLLKKASLTDKDINYYIFHQANKYILEHIKKRLSIPDSKFLIDLENTGNTTSSTIPIALKNGIQRGELKNGDLVMLIGFGTGFSIAGTIFHL